MKTILRPLSVSLILLCLETLTPAAVRYVDLNSANPTPPYTNWATAATSIQDAVNVSYYNGGDTVLVTNGVYQTGATWATLGYFGEHGMSNRVRLTGRSEWRVLTGRR